MGSLVRVQDTQCHGLVHTSMRKSNVRRAKTFEMVELRSLQSSVTENQRVGMMSEKPNTQLGKPH